MLKKSGDKPGTDHLCENLLEQKSVVNNRLATTFLLIDEMIAFAASKESKKIAFAIKQCLE